MDDDAIERAAALLLAAQRDHEQLCELPRSCRPDTLAEAYAIQARFVAGLGGAPVGYKVAASNPAIQKRFNITAPLSGRLIEGRVFTSPAMIDPSALFRIGIETEYAFRMGRDLPPAGAPYGRERVAEAVAALVPAIEVVDWRFANATAIGALLMVTDNAFGAYWVAGAAIADWRDLEIVHAEVVMRIGGTLGACAVEVLMLGDWRAAAGEVGFWPECGHLAARLWDGNPRPEGRKGRDSRFIRGRWALRAAEQVHWQASTCLSTWPPSPSA